MKRMDPIVSLLLRAYLGFTLVAAGFFTLTNEDGEGPRWALHAFVAAALLEALRRFNAASDAPTAPVPPAPRPSEPPPIPPLREPRPRPPMARSTVVDAGLPPTHVPTGEHVARLYGREVVGYAPDNVGPGWTGTLQHPERTSFFIGTRHDYQPEEEPEGVYLRRCEALLADPNFDRIESLILGAWSWEVNDSAPEDVYGALIERADRLTRLEDLILGEATQDESEISWLVTGDVGPVLSALPALRHAWVRGCYEISALRSSTLTHLTLQTGGCPQEVIDALLAAELPALRQLTIWLGTDEYGRTAEAASLPGLLDRFPHLEHLGLQDADNQDEVIEAVLAHPGIHRLKSLDFSMGTTTDRGARAILACPAARGLSHLNLRHHFIADDGLLAALRALSARVNLDDRLSPDDGFLYPEVSE